MQAKIIKISDLHLNTGQIKDVPKNPRFIKDERYEALKKSIEDDPEMLQLREIVAYDNNGELVVILGNMRYRAMKELGYKDAPVKALPTETDAKKLRAYIPNPKGRILGISKIGRVVDYCAAKLQIQERLVREIVDILSDALKSKYPPLGVALVMEGEHLCKSMRGAKKKGKMKSSYLVGAFKDDAQLRNEFFNLIK